MTHLYIYIFKYSLFYCGFGFTGQTALISILHIVIIVTSSWFLFGHDWRGAKLDQQGGVHSWRVPGGV